MMDQNKMREAFEKWLQTIRPLATLRRNDDGSYWDVSVDHLWQAWQYVAALSPAPEAAEPKWKMHINAKSWAIHRNDGTIEITESAQHADECRRVGFLVENQYASPAPQQPAGEAGSDEPRCQHGTNLFLQTCGECSHAASAAPAQVPGIDAMVNRFLGWKLPQTFAPDCGITFTRPSNLEWWPIGTNLFTAVEAKAMFEHCLKYAAPLAANPCPHCHYDHSVGPLCKAAAPEDREREALEVITATRKYLIEVVRAFGEVSCARFIEDWHQPDRIYAALQQHQREGE
jgi:hypothetical protein